MADNTRGLTTKPTRPDQVARTGEWAPFEGLRREIDRLFEDFRPFDWGLPERLHRAAWRIAPAIDLVEKDKEYEVTVELPGIDEKNIEVRLSNRTLTIKGEKSEDTEKHGNDYHLSERRYGSFERSIELPEGVDADRIEASFAKGVLTLKLPKTEEARKMEKKIAIKAG